jgi:HK97 family phage prohead protease
VKTQNPAKAPVLGTVPKIWGQGTAMERITKSIVGNLEKTAGGTFVLSSSDVDRDDDTISADALKNAITGKKTLITLWQHKQDQPIGFWENLRVEGKRLLGDLRLASTNLGLMVKQLLDDDVPLGASIGFMGSGEWDEKRNGINWKDIELFECSVVSVPANPNAMRIAKSFGVDLSSFEASPSPASGQTEAASAAAISKARSAVARANLTMRTKT